MISLRYAVDASLRLLAGLQSTDVVAARHDVAETELISRRGQSVPIQQADQRECQSELAVGGYVLTLSWSRPLRGLISREHWHRLDRPTAALSVWAVGQSSRRCQPQGLFNARL